jgi:hypothetical protein
MQIEVFINKIMVFEQPVDYWELDFVTSHLEGKYLFETLRTVGIECQMFVSGVQSKMNSKWFKETEEPYDHLF